MAPRAGNSAAAENASGDDPEISIVVVTHNSADVLRDLVESLLAHPPMRPWELVVVDNASRDSSVEIIRRSFPEATIVLSLENRGFAAAVNLGMRSAKGEFSLLANPDVTWDSDVIGSLCLFIEDHPRAAAVCPRLEFPDGRSQPSTRRFPTHANIWFSRGSPLSIMARGPLSGLVYTLADPDKPSQVQAAAATFMLIRRSAFDAVGGMDPGYFLYVEDTDLCRRWADAGRDVWIDPRVRVTHRCASLTRRDRWLSRHHRAGIRRYFSTHYPRKRLRNALLFSALSLADRWDAVAHRRGREKRGA